MVQDTWDWENFTITIEDPPDNRDVARKCLTLLDEMAPERSAALRAEYGEEFVVRALSPLGLEYPTQHEAVKCVNFVEDVFEEIDSLGAGEHHYFTADPDEPSVWRFMPLDLN